MRPVRNALRRTLPPILALVFLAIAAGFGVARTVRAWYTTELITRARLAGASARQPLVDAASRRDSTQLARVLGDIVRDDRVVGAALCAGLGTPLASTTDFPVGALRCEGAETGATAAGAEGSPRSQLVAPGDGSALLHVTRVAIAARAPSDPAASSTPLQLLVAQDYTQVRDREQLALLWGLGSIVLLAGAAAALTVLAARMTSEGWIREIRQALRGERDPETPPSPLLEDVRAMVQRQSAATAAVEGGDNGGWTRERLRLTMAEHLEEDGLVIVANREPYIHEHRPDGGIEVRHPASGLVSALEPVMRACSGVWIAHGSGTADRETSDAHDRLPVPPGEESYTLRRVWMTEEEESGYYYGFANEGLWPLCHLAYARPIFRASDWDYYCQVNERFADAVVAEASVDDPIVLVQDYHFAMAPRMIRERLPRATVITFWHIPFPNTERFGICPFREELLSGLLGSSIVGFHTQAHCNQFLDAVDTFVESRIDRLDQAVIRGGTRTLVRPYPISVEWPIRALEEVPAAAECRREIFAELGLAPDAFLGVGVDRLDYTKGLEERIEAVERLLERRPDLIGRFSFVQLAAPSRVRIPRYQEITDAVEEGVKRINARFGTDSYQPVIFLRQHHEPERVYRFYRAAHVCYVSSLDDGMNLVSKEFIAARDDEQGVLVLSQFAGAAHELPDALIVNPYDLEAASGALARAVDMSPAEQGERMRGMRAVVAERNVYRWAGRMLLDASQLRQRARRTLHLTQELAETAT